MKLGNKNILFGIGNQKRNIATYLLENNDNIIAIVDNDVKKQGIKIRDNLYVKSVEETMPFKDDKNTYIIITAYGTYAEMKKQLLDLGWDEQKIIIAIKEISFFSSYEFKCYLNNIDLKNPTPTILNIELSGYCNCKCIYCPFHGIVNLKKGHKGLMDVKTMDAIINQIKNIPTIRVVDTTGPGEIFINKQWFELLQKLLNETQVEEVIMYTNGMLLIEENIHKITLLNAKRVQVEVSIDGENAVENDKYRVGAKYNIIKENIYKAKEIFSGVKKDIDLVITNCCVSNLEEIQNKNYIINSKENPVPQYIKEDFPDIESVSQKTFFYGYDVELGMFNRVKVKWKNKESRCMNLFHRIAIDYAGNLLRCSCGQAGVHSIGTVFDDNILKIWEIEEEMQKARRNFIEGKESHDFCDGCPGKGLGSYYILVKNKE